MKIIILLIIIIFSKNTMATPTANYTITKQLSKNIEIRQYEKIIIARITSRTNDQDKLFNSLFQFISKNNSQNKKIQMTTPVLISETKDKLSMSFIMPDGFNLANMPQPNNKNIKIEAIKNQKFIAIRFSGRSNSENFDKYNKILLQEIKINKVKTDIANPIKAYYNHPWTLPILKKNEILYKILP